MANLSYHATSLIDFGIRSYDLRMDDIGRTLCLEPTKAFEKGEKYLGRERAPDGGVRNIDRVRPYGVWHYCTDEFIHSNSIDTHGLFLLGKLEPVAEHIHRYLADDTYFTQMTIWHVGAGGFNVSAGILCRLAALCEHFRIVCWESGAEEPQDRIPDGWDPDREPRA